MKKSNRVHRLPIKSTKTITLRRAKSCSDILAQDDVNGILNDLADYKSDMDDLIVIWTDKKGDLWFQTTKGIKESTALWMMEITKQDILNEGDE
jgi:hypothetical protein